MISQKITKLKLYLPFLTEYSDYTYIVYINSHLYLDLLYAQNERA